MRVPFVGGSYESQSIDASCERTVNWYPEILEQPNGKSKVALYPVPGYTLFCTLPETSVSCLYAVGGRCFAVAGTSLYEIYSVGTFLNRGTLDASTTVPATMCSSGVAGDELFVTSGESGYTLTLSTNAWALVLDSATAKAHFGGYLDGYFVALDTDTSTLRLSDLLDGSTWGALSVAQRITA
jgi:hypothetical protein